ncbi:MAG: hypothetical protein K2L00_00715, partial [Muribaculaceae bacterium]|nr:hypothetical protein [Muribaculaceae bacterium]
MNTNDNDATQRQSNDDVTKLPTNDDATRLSNSDDATQLADSKKPTEVKASANAAKPAVSSASKKEHGKMAKKAGVYAAGGVLLGGASALYADMKGNTHAAPAEVETPEDTESQEGVIIADANGEEAVAATDITADEDMTFDEAFANARAEMGPGSSFEWKGNVYATYTKEEWAGMTDDEKADFYEQISIPNPHSEAQEGVTVEAAFEEPAGHHETEEQETQNEPTDTSEPTEQTTTIEAEQATEEIPEELPEIEGVEIVTVEAPQPEIEMEGEIQILGVENIPETGANIGTLNIDGQEVFVVDVDGDMVFDAMVMDVNQDGMIDDDEIMNIQD